METLRIKIINPKARKLIDDLEDMDLIEITEPGDQSRFSDLLKRLRTNSDMVPDLDEITSEVEKVRELRNEH